MTDETHGSEDTGPGNERGGARSARLGDGIRQGIGVLTAFKDALEETIQEARDRGDLSTERAREVMKDALGKAQSAAGEARDRLDFAHQGELEALRSAVDSIRDRVASLEAHVFGAERGSGDGGSGEGGAGPETGAADEEQAGAREEPGGA